MGLCSVDVVNRDVNDINSHVLVAFEDVIAEPEGARSSACIWKVSYCCFNLWKNTCYKLATLLCGCCTAAYWGCIFAEVAFEHVWCCTPMIKSMEIHCTSVRKVFRMCLGCCLDPICESCGMFFHIFKRGE